MKVNIKETLDILNEASKVTVKHIKPKNSTLTVLKSTSVRNYLKMCEE